MLPTDSGEPIPAHAIVGNLGATMRILHTADWHIGHTLAGHDRIHEHRAALKSLAGIAGEVGADALLLTGDVYDHQNPSGEAQRVFYEALEALRRARPRLTIVVTAGNHDAAGRLEAAAPLLAALDVHVVGNVSRQQGVIDAARHLIPLRDEDGRIAAEVLAVSFPTAACVPPVPSCSGDSMDACQNGSQDVMTRRLYSELQAATGAGNHGVPLIVTGHLTVAGGRTSDGSERQILIGGAASVRADVFPAEAAYVALGHLHKAQAVGRETIRYAGSLFPLSASEVGYEHGVSLVTLEDGRVAVRHIPIPRPVPVLRVPAAGWLRVDEIEGALRALDVPSDLPMALRPFVQLCLARDGLTIGYRAEIDRIAAERPVRLLDPRMSHPPTASTAPFETLALTRLAELDPADMFRQAFEDRHTRVPTESHLAAFDQAVSAALAEA
jgi:exonuclease SbcD